MGKRYDWEQVVRLCEELAPQCNSWQALADSLASRIGKTMPRRTLAEGTEREMGLRFADYDEYRELIMGKEAKFSLLASALLAFFRKEGHRDTPYSLLELSEMLDRSMTNILAAADELHDAGYMIEIMDDRRLISMPTKQPPSYTTIPMAMYQQANVYRFGVVSDTHLANRHERLEVLNAAYDFYEQEGIQVVLHAGNTLDGECAYNRHELLAHGVEGQIAYMIQRYPQREGIVTKFITGECHEGWWGKEAGFDVGRYMHMSFAAKKRADLQWIGHIETDLSLSDDDPRSILRIMHPGGGTAYATSYSVQKIVESWQGGEKPSVAIFGHYHKYLTFYPREVFSIMAACTCDQTTFMRKRKLAAHVGFLYLEIYMTSLGGVCRVKHEFFPFYDKGYYQSWDYRSMYD